MALNERAEGPGSEDSDNYLSDSGSDGEGYDYEEEVTLDRIKKSCTIKFGIRSSYTSHWAPGEAFRELVQNWRDGIITAFRLPEKDFQVIREERCNKRHTTIVYKVWRPNSEPKEWLGYIRFHGLNDGEGTIDITNRQATLQPGHLELGGTTKSSDSHQAGAHGEGLKLALLVLQRNPQNHCVHAFTGAFSWTFNFSTQGKLVAHLNRITPQRLQRAQKKSAKDTEKGLAPFTAAANADVQFIIGQKATGRDAHRYKTKRDQASLEDFRIWCTSALFLQDVQDEGIVTTKHGNLITDGKLHENLYLKGLLLQKTTPFKSASITGKPLKYRYNFQDGIFSIWNKVLLLRPSYVSHLSNMLNSSEPEYADVSMAKDFIQPMTVEFLKEHLFSNASKWYYSVKEKNKEMLKHREFIQTTEEEQQHRFLAAEVVTIPTNTFAQDLDQLVRASFHTCPQTDGTTLQFVKGSQSSLHTFYLQDESLFKIHKKWLNRAEAVQELGLPEDLSDTDILFHTVKRLFSDALDQVPNDRFSGDDSRTRASSKKRELTRAEQRILDYARVKKFARDGKGGLEKDAHVRKHFFDDVGYEDSGGHSTLTVQIHGKVSCGHLRKLLTAKDVMGTDCIEAFPLDPIQKRLDERHGCTLASRLDHALLTRGKSYFAVIFNLCDPSSILVFSDNIVSEEQPPSPKQTAKKSTKDAVPAERNDKGPHLSASDSPGRPSTPLPELDRARSSSPDSTPRQVIAPPVRDSVPKKSLGDSYVIGDQITSLDILTPRNWFKATNSKMPQGGVVIGLLKNEEETNTPQKRRRTNTYGKRKASETIEID
ncbi:Fc.00g085520.m01.CDS01 [Cosmosporella sp. VM-42]